MQDNKEIWKDIPSYEGSYQVSNHSRIRSLDRIVPHKRQGSKFIDGQIMKTTHDTKGYLQVHLSGTRNSHHSAHRIIARAFIPNPENKPQVNHRNGVKDDNRIENLEWCTQSENMRHALDTGIKVAPKGEMSGGAKLKRDQVLAIRTRYNEGGITHRELAIIYGVDRTNIGCILSCKTWKHI